MTAIWVVVACLTAVAVYMTGWAKGRVYGIAEGHDKAARWWQDEARCWERQCDAYEVEIAKADRIIADLIHGTIPDVFLAGQVFQAERKDADL